jgi:spermidine synthase
MLHSIDKAVRKSCRQHLGTIRYWEQRLNYVYVDGVATINKKNPITGMTFALISRSGI